MRENMAGVFLPNSNKFCALYKKKGSPWKETHRMRCMQRLKIARDELVNRYRKLSATPSDTFPVSTFQTTPSIMPDVMKRDWKALFGSNFDLPPFSDDDYEDDVDVEQQLRAQEMGDLEMRYIEWLMSDSVTCPICQIQSLEESPRGIICSCGFELRVELSLQKLSEYLNHLLTSHQTSCIAQPRFESPSGNLIIFCQECRFNAEIA